MSAKRRNLLRRRFYSVRYDIIAVDRDIKPAYLWDAGTATMKEVNDYLSGLLIAGVISRPLEVVKVRDTLLVCCLSSLVLHLRRVLQGDFCTYVNIASGNQPPSILSDKKQLDGINEMVEIVLERLKIIRSTYEDDSNFDLKCEPHWNITTLFGVLLGFPVVYWFDCQKEKNGTLNSMSVLTVRVYTVSGKIRKLTNTSHVIYSFSVPDCLATETEHSISLWYNGIDTKQSAVKDVFISLQLNYDIKELYSLVL